MTEHDEPEEKQPAKESENDQSSTKVKTMAAAGKIRVMEDKFGAPRRVDAGLHPDITDEEIEIKQASQNRRVNAKLHSDVIEEKSLPEDKDPD